MIIGHLPAGYILSRLSYSRFYHIVDNYRAYLFWGLFGSIAPDLDMFYFHFIDHRQTNHHKYVSHYPIAWITIIVISLYLTKIANYRRFILVVVFSISGFLHLVLDSIVGDIWALAPFVNQSFAIATVPARYHPWWINFILHWSFSFEIMVFVWALWIWKYSPDPDSQIDLNVPYS